ncbi:2-dehydropantoate 2-reductase N-terminal domain-containing protein [Georgenia sp. M64]|jgi:2-dehydropantoate 2-reductase|uniref:ketopantoate reductase family protein n=1 Tax=Georgenia sp. M64 TaxID=3120520 RepID=UPI0030E1A4CC
MIAVVGPGAVGGLLAALLHRAGEDVVAVGRPASAARIAAEGVTVRSELFGDFTAAVPATTAVPRGAAVVLAVKAYGLADVLPGIREARAPEVLALLNGVEHAAALRDLPGAVVSGSVQVEADRVDSVVVQRGRYLVVTVPDGAEHSATARALARAGVSVRAGGPEAEVLWRKLSFLAPTALLTTWAGAPLGPALDRDPAVTDALLGEVAALADAQGWPTTASDIGSFLRRLPPSLESSMQHDAARGGPTELDAVGGALVRLGRVLAVPTPTLERLVAELQARGSTSR